MGSRVVLDATAELRLTRGFISMITMRPLSGLTPNWMLEPPVSTPTARITWKLASRMIWYSLSVRVWMGATVIEPPVCTPIGSKFSMEQMITQLSARSRMTSISNSFQPSNDSSIRISATGERSMPRLAISSNSSRVVGAPPAGATQGEGRPDYEGKTADPLRHCPGLLQVVGCAGNGNVQADGQHELLEGLAVLPFVNGLGFGPAHFHPA